MWGGSRAQALEAETPGPGDRGQVPLLLRAQLAPLYPRYNHALLPDVRRDEENKVPGTGPGIQ